MCFQKECSLKVFPSIPCGLEKLSEATWGRFVQKRSELPVCKTGHESGELLGASWKQAEQALLRSPLCPVERTALHPVSLVDKSAMLMIRRS